VHIPKELAIFPNSHTKYDQGVIAAHNRHLGRCPKFWSLGTLVKVRHLDFRPQKWVTGWMPFQELGDSRRDAQNNGPRPSTLHGYLPALWCRNT
jgi:hypothetical protein